MISIATVPLTSPRRPGQTLTMPSIMQSDARTPSGNLIPMKHSLSAVTPLPSLSGLAGLGSLGDSSDNALVDYFNPPSPASKALRIGGAVLMATAVGLFAVDAWKKRKKR